MASTFFLFKKSVVLPKRNSYMPNRQKPSSNLYGTHV